MSGQRVRRVTSQQVALEAGVSRTTVSLILNDAPHQTFPDQTRDRVRDAARRLGYQPSAAARALRTGRSEVVLCLLPDWPIGHVVGEMLEQLSSACEACGFAFVVHPRTRNPLTEVWKRLTPSAVIAFDLLTDQELVDMTAAGIEVTLALQHGSSEQTRAVAYVDERLGWTQAEHLVAAGHRRLGYADPGDSRLDYFAIPRLEGVRQACQELGVDPPWVATVHLDASAAASEIQRWRAADPPVTAVCAYNDEVALALLAGLRLLGLDCPGDLSVIGLDDIPAARMAQPPLTTVSRSMADQSHRIIEAVMAELGTTPPWTDPVPGDVVVVQRGSTRPVGEARASLTLSP